MDYSAKNIFDLEEPDAYYCIATYYRRAHSQLFVRVVSNEPNPLEDFYLTFQAVEYFEGSFMWSGANFCVATDDECKKLLNERGLDTGLCRVHRLFVVEQAGLEVKIIAVRDVIKSKDPGDFSWLIKTPADN